jgi:hypothetical protein
MEPIPVFFEKVRRSAMVLKPKKLFYNWLISIDPDDEQEEMDFESEVYLLPYFEEVKKMEAWLMKKFDLIFSDQLNNWYIDEELWPQKRTFKMFKEWFDYSLHTMIWDTEESFIEKH